MPRRARIVLAGVPVHITHRGNNRQACFHADNDRAFYLHHLRRLTKETANELHAYCLMGNHVHLLLTPGTDQACARLMQRLAQLHTQYVNKRYGRSGSLWEGRFRSCLVQAEDYLLACYRYVEANPVRAGLCRDPREFEWSSHRANAGSSEDPCLTPHEEFTRLGLSPTTRRQAYRELFQSDPRYWRTDEIRAATNGNYALGSEAFKREMALRLGVRVDRGKPGRFPVHAAGRRQLDLLLDGENVVCP
jgi:putative transposase